MFHTKVVRVFVVVTLSTQRVLNQKEFYCSVLKSSRDRLQEYAVKNGNFH